MNDKVYSITGEYLGTFSTYFVVGKGKMFETSNFYFEDKLENCFYVKKYGSNIAPVFYVDTKVNNEWISKGHVISGYREFLEFVINNLDSYICLRGFSRIGFSDLAMFILKFEKSTVNSKINDIKGKNPEKSCSILRRLFKNKK